MTLTLERLREVLRYEPGTGHFYWVKPTAARAIAKFNAGQPAGSVSGGYIIIAVDGVKYPAHRLALWMTTGSIPLGEVDHIDGNRGNNKITNIRDVTGAENRQNVLRPRAHNRSSGILGVSRLPSGRFRAKVSSGGRTNYFGTYDRAEDAHLAYLNAKRALHTGCTI